MRGASGGRFAPAAAAVCACVVAAPAAHADAASSGARLRDALAAEGASATLLAPRYGFAGDTSSVLLPVHDAPCTVVALLGARGLGFTARLVPDEAASDALEREVPRDEPGTTDGAEDASTPHAPGDRAASSSGVALLTRCGAPARRVQVRFESGRGTFELVVAAGSAAATHAAARAVAAALPDRAPRHPPPPPLGSALAATSLRERRLAAVDRAGLDGFSALRVEHLAIDDGGHGELTVPLTAGCHRLDVLDDDGTPRDLDAELRAESDERTLAKDLSEARDARLDACVGEDDLGRLRVVGARPGARLEVLASSLPPVPTANVVPLAAAELARLVRARGLGSLDPRATLVAHVGAGLTSVGFEGRPGRCYAAVAATSLGRPRAVGLRVVGPVSDAVDERGGDAPVAVAPVCFDGAGRPRARLEVAVRGSGVAADVAVFEVGARGGRP